MADIELRFKANGEMIENMKSRFDIANASEVGQRALKLLDWAIKEEAKGRQIASVVVDNDTEYVPVLL